MKKAFYTSVAVLFSSIVNSQQPIQKPFKLIGKIEGLAEGYVYLSYFTNQGAIRDSCQLKRRKFSLRGTISEPTLAFFRGKVKTMADSDSNATSLFLEPKVMYASAKAGHFKDLKLSGSKTQRESDSLNKEILSINKDDSFYAKAAVLQKSFIATHPYSYASAYLLSFVRIRWPFDTVAMLYANLDEAVQKSYFGNRVGKYIKETQANSTGKVAKNFIALDADGDSIVLSGFKGKYVLLDFWASWCKPCRESVPFYKGIYQKYKESAFSMIAISGDDDRGSWLGAIEKDDTRLWVNVLSGEKEATNKIHDQYSISVFPTLILIDPKGIILGRYTGMEEEPLLDKKLKEIFGK